MADAKRRVPVSRRTTLSAAGVGALVVLSLATPALGAQHRSRHIASAARGSVIHACYRKRTGRLRYRVPGSHCRRGEVAIDWGFHGGDGRRGAPGPRGPQGLEGFFGANGVTGATGAAGTSVAGPPGAEGAMGATGVTGAPGATGVSGVTGPTGLPGATGPSGATGPEGLGSVGPPGPTGPTGASGATGPTGATGAPLATSLASGQSESGAWIAVSPTNPLLFPFRTAGLISYPVPGAAGLNAKHAIYLDKAETSESAAERTNEVELGTGERKKLGEICPGTLEEPTAASGLLCVYTGVEEATNIELPPLIVKANGERGTQKTGALVEFRVKVRGEAAIRAQGTWALTG
jgi:hypothetical protein